MSLVGENCRLRVLGVPVDAVSMGETVDWVEDRIRTRRPGTHLCVNAANVVLARDNPDYRRLLERGDLVGADGQPVVWAARLLGHRLPGRVAGIDLMVKILARSREEGWGVYLLGSRQTVVDRLASRLAGEGVRVVGRRSGYFDAAEEPAILDEIKASEADVLFVGLPSPTKEEFVINRAATTEVPISIGVGGSFDVLAGELRRAPRLLQRLGLEWLFRLVQEPRRLFVRYTITNARFCALVVRAMLVRGRERG